MGTPIALLAVALAAASPHVVDSDGTLPDLVLTPGDYRTADIAEICDKTRHTSDVRNVPDSVKQQVFKLYGLQNKRDKWCNSEEGCEVDHLISLELGGSNEISNLWVEKYEGDWNAHDKDRLENELHKRVCSGRLDLRDAQEMIRSNWKTAYVRMFNRLPDGAQP